MGRSEKVVIWCIMAAAAVAAVAGTMEEDEKECADQLANLAACIPFVSGTAKRPTPECCQDTQKVKSSKPKCLCVLIKQSTDSSMGLPINTTLALQMPSACHIDAKVSDCPSILNLPPGSPDAKIFAVAEPDSTTTSSSSSSPASSSSSASKSTGSSSSSSDSKATPTSSDGRMLKLFEFSSFLVIMASAACLFI